MKTHQARTVAFRVGAAGVVGVALIVVSAVPVRAAASMNLIQNPGAEGAAGGDGRIVRVPDWTLAKGSQFTAVEYGTSGFPNATSPGPLGRGKNLFAGGPSAARSTASQSESLEAYAANIDGGSVGFTLAGWFGGYSSQGDNASLKIIWKNAAGHALGASVTVGLVTAAARHDATGLLQRSKKGAVPKGARSVLVEAISTRKEGSYDDGYLDNLSLVLTGV